MATFLLDSPSLLEGAFLLTAYGTLLVSDNCIKVRRSGVCARWTLKL